MGQCLILKKILSGVPQESVLGLVLFNIFFNHLENGAKFTLNTFADNTKLGRTPDTLESRARYKMTLISWRNGPKAIRFRKMKFNKNKYRVLHLGWKKFVHIYKLGKD